MHRNYVDAEDAIDAIDALINHEDKNFKNIFNLQF